MHYRMVFRPLNCEICLKEFSYSLNLNAHYTTQTGEKPYESDLCSIQGGKNFARLVH